MPPEFLLTSTTNFSLSRGWWKNFAEEFFRRGRDFHDEVILRLHTMIAVISALARLEIIFSLLWYFLSSQFISVIAEGRLSRFPSQENLSNREFSRRWLKVLCQIAIVVQRTLFEWSSRAPRLTIFVLICRGKVGGRIYCEKFSLPCTRVGAENCSPSQWIIFRVAETRESNWNVLVGRKDRKNLSRSVLFEKYVYILTRFQIRAAPHAVDDIHQRSLLPITPFGLPGDWWSLPNLMRQIRFKQSNIFDFKRFLNILFGIYNAEAFIFKPAK